MVKVASWRDSRKTVKVSDPPEKLPPPYEPGTPRTARGGAPGSWMLDRSRKRAEAARVDADEPDGGNDPQKRQLLK